LVVKNAKKKIPYPHKKCYRGINYVKKSKSNKSKKSSIPDQDNEPLQTTSFLDDMMKVFKNPNMLD
jgi:hypothetical protein